MVVPAQCHFGHLGARDMKRKRFTREDWLDFGLMRLAKDGPDALKLTKICAAADRTIGSFYHHFDDQSHFFDALMTHWRQKNTESVLAAVEELPDAKQQADQLDAIALNLDQSIEVGVRQFANQNARAAKEVAEVDALRIGYLAQNHVDRFGLGADEARQLAQLEYAAFVGAQTLWREKPPKQAQELSELFQRMVKSHFSP